MTEEQISQLQENLIAEKELLNSNEEYIESIGKLRKDNDKIESICIGLKFLNNYLKDGVEMKYAEKENRTILNEMIQLIIKQLKSIEERIILLEDK